MAIQIQFRRGTASQWTSANPILAEGEMGIETDTDQFKIGDGETNWNDLDYGGIQGAQGPIVTNIPPSTNTTVVSSDKGKYLNVSAGVTINTSTAFSSGDAVSIYNSSAGNITVTATGVTLRLAGTATTGNRTIAQKGLVTVLCVGSDDYVIAGSGLT